MTANKIASYTGMARPTVYRKIEDLREQGILESDGRGRVTVTQGFLNSPTLSPLDQRVNTVMRACAKLSKVDTL